MQVSFLGLKMDDSTTRDELTAPTNQAETQDSPQQLARHDQVEDQTADDDERVYVLGYN